MLIDCDTCQVRNVACGDCVVTVLTSTPADGELDGLDRAAIAVLAGSGLVPPLRLVPGGRTSTHGDVTVKRRATG